MTDEPMDAVVVQSLRAHAAAGVTTVHDLGDRGCRTLSFRCCPRPPRVVAPGRRSRPPAGHCHCLGGAVVGDVRVAVADAAERGVDVVKVMASGGFATPETRPAGRPVQRARASGTRRRGARGGASRRRSRSLLVGMLNALAAGVDGIEHFSGLSSEGGAQIDDELLDEVAAAAWWSTPRWAATGACTRSCRAAARRGADGAVRSPQLRRVLRDADRTAHPTARARRAGGDRVWIPGWDRRSGTATPGGPWATWSTPDTPPPRRSRRPRRSAAEACGLGGETGWRRVTAPISSSWTATSPPTSPR